MSEQMQEVGQKRGKRKHAVGFVTGDKRDKTISVRVTRLVKHKRYGKYLTRSTTFHAHDEKNDAREGDKVEIAESRPLSRQKRWRLINIMERAKR